MDLADTPHAIMEGGACACGQEQDRGRLRAQRSVREAVRTDGVLVELPRRLMARPSLGPGSSLGGRGGGIVEMPGRPRRGCARRVSGELREFHAWLDGVEPAWTGLEPAWTGLEPAWTGLEPAWTGLEPAWTGLEPTRWEALMREPSAENGPLRLVGDLADAELDGSAIVRNALVLLRAAAKGAGLELTARGYPTRANVAELRQAMDWQGCAFEERRVRESSSARRRSGSSGSFGHCLRRRGAWRLRAEVGFGRAGAGTCCSPGRRARFSRSFSGSRSGA